MSAPFNKDNSFALLIGVGKRDTLKEGKYMDITATDAQYLKDALYQLDVLQENNITTITNQGATCDGIRTALKTLVDQTNAKRADFVLIYFSGHGCVAKDEKLKEDIFYIIGNDTREENFPGSALTGMEFVNALGAIQCDKMLVLLDCCHAGGFDYRPIPFPEDKFLSGKNKVIISASESDQKSYLSSPVSVFTYSVIEAFEGLLLSGATDKLMTVFDLAMDVRERVVSLAGQVLEKPIPQQPQLRVLKNAQTYNYDLREFPKGKPRPSFLKDTVKKLDYDGKDIRLDVVPERNERDRNIFAWFQQTAISAQIGDHNINLQNVNAPVTINIQHGISVDEAVGKLRTRWREHQLTEIKKDGAIQRAYDKAYFLTKPGIDQIRLHFNINGFTRFDFAGIFTLEEQLQDALSFEESGISLIQKHYDDLCRGTINNGHSLITSKGIYNIQESIVTPMSRVVGQYLFRLLFGKSEPEEESKLEKILRKAKNANQYVEIILHFDTTNPESRQLASLPWESMYCPDIITKDQPEAERSKMDRGFFVVRAASVIREYHTSQKPKPKPIPIYERKGTTGLIDIDTWPENQGKKVNVSLLFLTRNADDLNDTYSAYAYIAQKINTDIHHDFQFEFLNKVYDGQVLYVAKDDFIQTVKTPASPNDFNILHVICDISDESLKLHFSQEESSTQPFKLSDLIDEMPEDPECFYDLVVLQAWKEDDPMVYKGFERIANAMLNLGSRVLSMPYTMHHNEAEKGKAAFFQILYSGLAHGVSLQLIVQKLREALVSRFAYGFPILYRNETIRIPSSKSETTSNERAVPPARQRDEVIKTKESESIDTTPVGEGFAHDPPSLTSTSPISKEDPDPKFKSNLFTRFKNLDDK